MYSGVEIPELRKRRRVWLVGTHSTGKSTLGRWISKEYQLPMVSEVARTLIVELGKKLDAIRLDPDLSDRFQWEIFERQMRAEAALNEFVSDRGCDHLAYAAEHSRMAHVIHQDMRFKEYMIGMKRGIVFYVRPHAALVVPDGIRAGLDWDSVVRIDGMVKFMLRTHGVPYFEIASLAMDERISTIEAVLGKPK
jgi:hypothetical protein